jgi:biopolymer transport protein ExbB/TolQ
MNMNLVDLWSEMGLPVRAVVVVLTVQALACLAVAIDRAILLWRSNTASREFAKKAAPLLDRGDFEGLAALASAAHGSHLASLTHAGVAVFIARTNAGDAPERAAELARRAIQRKGESLSDSLNRGLNVLASTGSTAPFVGLLGTVLGIINAFQMISATGSGGIGTIGAAIGEALIVTGYGLVVAIPTVLGWNALNARIGRYEMGLTNAGSELSDRLETADAPARAPLSEEEEIEELERRPSREKLLVVEA